MIRSRVALLATAVALAGACGDPEPTIQVFHVRVQAQADGQPLARVAISQQGSLLGETAADGSLTLPLQNVDGARVQLAAVCPDGYRLSNTIEPVHLRRIVSAGNPAELRPITVDVTCAPEQRNVVVAVSAGGIADMPVILDGREVARTDADGIAHVALALAPQTTIAMQLDTDAYPNLRPQDPPMTFTVGDHDDVFLFNRTFETVEPPAPPRVRRPPRRGPRLPVEITSGPNPLHQQQIRRLRGE